MKVSAISIYTDYCRIKRSEAPSSRLGQHYCNVMGLRETKHQGVDLFTCSNDLLSDKVFYKLCEDNYWDVLDLPIFGEYDVTSLKPV